MVTVYDPRKIIIHLNDNLINCKSDVEFVTISENRIEINLLTNLKDLNFLYSLIDDNVEISIENPYGYYRNVKEVVWFKEIVESYSAGYCTTKVVLVR